MIKSFLALFISIFFLVNNAMSQNTTRTIIGVVTIEGEQTVLDGAVVRVKGSDNYTGTQPDGVFYLSVKLDDSLLVCSFEGFYSREAPISSQTEYYIPLVRKKQLAVREIFSFRDGEYVLRD